MSGISYHRVRLIAMLKAAKDAVKKVKKRDGSIVPFDQAKITNAVHKAITAALGREDLKLATRISDWVTRELPKRFGGKVIPGVEDIQDIVEEALIEKDLTKVARAYILYRSERAKLREAKKLVPKDVKSLAE
ncbi:MAG: hypothetical protein HYS15_01660, partial [Candidatus Spechtbacteria bacterium]|nr:hypothetical protein [Candidatus Spechtbacteria bacterium]